MRRQSPQHGVPMSSRKVTAQVRRGGAVVDTALDRPVRRMPNGVSGVVFAGDVYPLRQDSSGLFVSLDDEPADKLQCGVFLDVTQDLVLRASKAGAPGELLLHNTTFALAIDTWTIESNQWGMCVAFNGSAQDAETLVDRIAAHGVGVRRWGASVRPSTDGVFYDWYLRLEEGNTRDQATQAVTRSIDGELDERNSAIAALNARMDQLRERVEVVSASAIETVEINRVLSAKNDKLTAQVARHKAENKSAKSALHEAEVHLADAVTTRGDDTEGLTTLRRSLAEATSERDDSNELAEEYSRDLDEANARHDELADRLRVAEEERDRLREDVIELREKVTRASQPASVARSTRDAVLRSRVWERLELDDSTIECFADRDSFAKPQNLLRALVKIDRREDSDRTSLTGYKRWWEVKVNTGVKMQEDMGRIYYHQEQDGRRIVFAHRKVDEPRQKKFVANITGQVGGA